MTISELTISLEIGLIYGLVAMGIYLTFRVINFTDLTCDGSFVLGAITASTLVKAGYPFWVALLSSILAGNLAGLTTGVLHTHFKIADLLSGILVAFMIYSINLHITQGIPNIALLDVPTLFSKIPTLILLGIICLIILLVFGYLFITDFGLALRSIGQNKSLAEKNGINIKIMILVGLALSNGLIAFSGALFSQYQGFADVGSGVGTIIIGFASVIIGEKLLPYRSIFIQLMSCFIGSMLYRLLTSLALHSEVLGLQTSDLNLITGILVIGIMCIPRRRTC